MAWSKTPDMPRREFLEHYRSSGHLKECDEAFIRRFLPKDSESGHALILSRIKLMMEELMVQLVQHGVHVEECASIVRNTLDKNKLPYIELLAALVQKGFFVDEALHICQSTDFNQSPNQFELKKPLLLALRKQGKKKEIDKLCRSIDVEYMLQQELGVNAAILRVGTKKVPFQILLNDEQKNEYLFQLAVRAIVSPDRSLRDKGFQVFLKVQCTHHDTKSYISMISEILKQGAEHFTSAQMLIPQASDEIKRQLANELLQIPYTNHTKENDIFYFQLLSRLIGGDPDMLEKLIAVAAKRLEQISGDEVDIASVHQLCEVALRNNVGVESIVSIMRRLRAHQSEMTYHDSFKIVTETIKMGQGIDVALNEISDVLKNSKLNEQTVTSACVLLAAVLDHGKGAHLTSKALARCSPDQDGMPYEAVLASMIRNRVPINKQLNVHIARHPNVQFANAYARIGDSLEYAEIIAKTHLPSRDTWSILDVEELQLLLALVKQGHAFDMASQAARSCRDHYVDKCRSLVIDIYHALVTQGSFTQEAMLAAQKGLFDRSEEVRVKSTHLLRTE